MSRRRLRLRHTTGTKTDLRSMSKDALVKLARSKGINASSRWKTETIVSKLEE